MHNDIHCSFVNTLARYLPAGSLVALREPSDAYRFGFAEVRMGRFTERKTLTRPAVEYTETDLYELATEILHEHWQAHLASGGGRHE
jgi:hypothetical protein